MSNNKQFQAGQSLVEVIVALGIAVVVVVAFSSATLNAVRGAQYSKNENQATRIAQKTLEFIRAVRDQDNDVNNSDNNPSNETKMSLMWGDSNYVTTTGKCYTLNETLITLTLDPTCAGQTVSNDFTRVITFKKDPAEQASDAGKKVLVNVTVSWNDNRGTQSAESNTILSNWR